MSLERLENVYPNNGSFVERISRRDEFKRGHSDMRAFAELIYHEGSNGLRDVVKDMRKRKGGVPRDPFSYEMPVEFADRVDLNGAGVLFGSLFVTIENLVVDRVYDPHQFAARLKQGFRHTPWKKGFNFDELREPHYLTHDAIAPLTQLVNGDRRFSFLFTTYGMHMLPDSLAGDIEGTGFQDAMLGNFARIYLSRSSVLRASVDRRERPRTPTQINLPQNKPLTFR